MRRYPSDDFCGTSPDGRCIDQLQANSLDPATPVAILHASKDDQWLYVCSRDYSGWISANHVALEPDHASRCRLTSAVLAFPGGHRVADATRLQPLFP